MPKKDPAQLKKVSFSLPFGIGKAEWESDPTERRAAWSLYVELVTRISVQKMSIPNGSESEALASLYNLFAVTREILKSAGPDIGRSKNSVGAIALAVLNRGVRPFLTKWHSQCDTQHASTATPDMNHSIVPAALREDFVIELEAVQNGLAQYARALAIIAGVESVE
jgi:hypothetical protein